jgi:nicotinate phosphoribosyltransferase
MREKIIDNRKEFEAADYYLLKAANVYYKHAPKAKVSFEVFTRKLPNGYNYLLAAGLEQVLEVFEEASKETPFSEEYLQWLEKQEKFDDEFIDCLYDFKFRGNIYAMPEGTVFFANEPLLRVEGNPVEAQIAETFVLRLLRYQTSVATKASRIVRAAKSVPVIDFSARGTNDAETSLLATRASYIAGCIATSNNLAAFYLDIPVTGTMPHALIQFFGSDAKAFDAYEKNFPDQTALVDTFDVEKAIREAVKRRFVAIRVDSGGKEAVKFARGLLDELGKEEVKIVYSGDLDEYVIEDMLNDPEVKIDAFGVGRKMALPQERLDFVYKLKKVEIDGEVRYVTKFSKGKGYYPGDLQVWRYEKDGKFERDIISLWEEELDGSEPLLKMYMKKGKLVEELPSLQEIRSYAKEQLEKMPEDEYCVVPTIRLQKILEELKKVMV